MMLVKVCRFIPGVSFASSVIKQFVDGFKEGVKQQRESSRAEMAAVVEELLSNPRKHCRFKPYLVTCLRPHTGTTITIKWRAFDAEMAAKYACRSLGPDWVVVDGRDGDAKGF